MKNNQQPTPSYCRSRCRGEIKYAVIGSIIALLSLLTIVFILFLGVQFDDRFTTILALILSPIFLFIGGFLVYLGIRNALFPQNSSLAKSIRSQMDTNWDRELPVGDLFAMVDRDIAENGRWFGNLAIGKEWILGDTAMRLSLVRAVFYKMEYHTLNNKSSYSYTLTLYDCNRKPQIHTMRSEDTTMQAYRLICVMVPEAACGHAGQESQLPKGKAFVEFNGEFEKKRALRLDRQADQMAVPQDLILFSSDGNVTSRVTEEALTHALTALKETGTHFRLRCTWPLESQLGMLAFLNCGSIENRCYLMCAFAQSDNRLQVYRTWAGEAELLEMVRRFVRSKEIPDVRGWTHRLINMEV